MRLFYLIRSYGIFEAIPVSLAAAVLFLVIRIILIKENGLERKPLITEAAGVLLAGYIAALLMIVWVTRWSSWGNFVYMLSNYKYLWQGGYYYVNNGRIVQFFSDRLTEHERFEVLANVVLFMPLGFLLPVYWRRLRWWQVDLICLGTTCVVELVQPLVGGVGDLDDVIANALGGIIGCALAKIFLTVGKCVKNRKNCD